MSNSTRLSTQNSTKVTRNTFNEQIINLDSTPLNKSQKVRRPCLKDTSSKDNRKSRNVSENRNLQTSTRKSVRICNDDTLSKTGKINRQSTPYFMRSRIYDSSSDSDISFHFNDLQVATPANKTPTTTDLDLTERRGEVSKSKKKSVTTEKAKKSAKPSRNDTSQFLGILSKTLEEDTETIQSELDLTERRGEVSKSRKKSVTKKSVKRGRNDTSQFLGTLSKTLKEDTETIETDLDLTERQGEVSQSKKKSVTTEKAKKSVKRGRNDTSQFLGTLSKTLKEDAETIETDLDLTERQGEVSQSKKKSVTTEKAKKSAKRSRNDTSHQLLDILSKTLEEPDNGKKSLDLSFTYSQTNETQNSGQVKMMVEIFENNKTVPQINKSEIIDLTKTGKKDPTIIDLTSTTKKRKLSQNDSHNETKKRKRWSSSSDYDSTQLFNGTLDFEDEPDERRQTFQLERSVTDVSILKKLEVEPAKKFSKVTIRQKKHDRLSSTMFETKPSPKNMSFTTSTPFIKGQPSKSLIGTEDRNASLSKKAFVSKVKVPNFALIHQKAYEKMEDIQNYQQRKEERAKLLFSGLKPLPVDDGKKNKQTKKQLKFDVSTLDEQEKPGFIPLPSTPFPKASSYRRSVSTPLPKSEVKVPSKSPLPKIDNKSLRQSAVKLSSKKGFQFNLPSQTKTVKSPAKQNNAFKFTVTENKENFVKFGRVPIKSGFNRFGFKLNNNMPTTKLSRTEEIKLIAVKSKTVQNKREENRSVIKGVRSNRRFDLLMKMRNK